MAPGDDVPPSPSSRPVDKVRPPLERAWRRFREIPFWLQVIAWLLAWPLLLALLIARSPRLGTAAVPLGAVVLLVGGGIWMSALAGGGDSTPDPEVASTPPTNANARLHANIASDPHADPGLGGGAGTRRDHR